MQIWILFWMATSGCAIYAAQTMREATEERIRYIEAEQMPMFDRMAKSGKVPVRWAAEMKEKVIPLSIDAVRRFATFVDGFNVFDDLITSLSTPSRQQAEEVIAQAVSIGSLAKDLHAVHIKWATLHRSTHEKYGLPLPNSWNVNRGKWNAVISAGLRLGEAARAVNVQTAAASGASVPLQEVERCHVALQTAMFALDEYAGAFQGRVAEGLKRLSK